MYLIYIYFLLRGCSRVKTITYLRDSDQILRVDDRQAELLHRQMEGADRNARHVLRADLHLGQEAINQVNGSEQDIVRQLVPNLQAAQHMGRSVAGADRDFAIL